MKVITKGNMRDKTTIQIEEWSENYSFMPYGNTLASYPKSKANHEGAFSPKANETYRFDFVFNSYEETKNAYNELITGSKDLSDYGCFLRDRKYQDCI